MDAVGKYIMLRQDPRRTHIGGLFIPEIEKRDDRIPPPYSGIIESVGEDVVGYKKGDHIAFDDMCRPWVVEIDDYEVIVFKDTDVICKFEDEK
jgi:co-chaperonin GroES (HSP10)